VGALKWRANPKSELFHQKQQYIVFESFEQVKQEKSRAATFDNKSHFRMVAATIAFYIALWPYANLLSLSEAEANLPRRLLPDLDKACLECQS
jgi:hypothetical protein